MNQQHVLIVSGKPGVGKTHVATRLARHFSLPLVAKDTIKESLFDALGTGDARWSRMLSNASFAAMFAVAAEILEAGGSLVLEGNFRVREHEPRLHSLLDRKSCRLTQVLCRLPDELRRERLERRAARAERHPGHLDRLFLRRASDRSERADDFLDLPGERLVHHTDGDPDIAWRDLLAALDPVLRV